MPNIVADPRAKDESDHAAAALVNRHEGRFRIERAAARKSNDVTQKTQRAAKRPVLVVDVSIDMPAVCGADDRSSGLMILVRPQTQFDVPIVAGGQLAATRESLHHEQPRMPVESLFHERARDNALLVNQQLRLDPVNAGA